MGTDSDPGIQKLREAAGPSADSGSATTGDVASGLTEIIDLIARAATSRLSLLTAYAAAVAGAVLAFQNLPGSTKHLPVWLWQRAEC
jgi:hypothetical protein